MKKKCVKKIVYWVDCRAMEASRVEKIDQKHSREYHHRMFVVCCHRRVFFTTCTRYLLCKWRQWDTTWHIAQHTKVVIYSCQSRVSASSYVHLSCIFQFQNHTKKLFPVWHPLGGCEWALKAFESALHIIELVYSVKKDEIYRSNVIIVVETIWTIDSWGNEKWRSENEINLFESFSF